jgi:hypothetical protein
MNFSLCSINKYASMYMCLCSLFCVRRESRREGLEMIINNLCEVVKTAVNKHEKDCNPHTAHITHTHSVCLRACLLASLKSCLSVGVCVYMFFSKQERGMRLCIHARCECKLVCLQISINPLSLSLLCPQNKSSSAIN